MRKIMLLVLLSPVLLWAKVDIDVAVFRFDREQADLEIYYTIPRFLLVYSPTDAGQVATAVLSCKLSKDGEIWKELSWKIQDALPASSPNPEKTQIIDRLKVLAPPGDYHAVFYIRNETTPDQVDSTVFTAVVPDFSSPALGLSDIEFAAAIDRNAAESDPFYKNTLRVVPNPSRVFGKEHGPLMFYLETYNLTSNLPGESYIIRYAVTTSDGRMVARKAAVRRKRIEAGVEYFTVPVDTLPTGSYQLKFSLADSSGAEQASKSAKFFIYNQGVTARSDQADTTVISLALQSEMGALSESALDQEFDSMRYLTSSEDRRMYKALKNIEAKRNYIHSLWQKKSGASDPRRLRQEYLNRVRYCNEHFTVMKKEGWQTDRGRVYIQYGAPSYVHQNPSTEGLWPYETWDYPEIQGGAVFVFADFSGFKDFQLIHSTVIGEISNYNYMDRIRSGR
ncbi:MAG TPA: GWxTD domain-containing protein [bacterium]|nr:GWxTD domain-containing protein [bacterium]